MLKREIKYEDFDGNEQTDIFYFNISKPEMVELEVEYPEGLKGFIEKIIETKDNKELINQFKRIILLAYGKKSDDGKRFIKNDELREEFSQTAAYQALFIELATVDNAAADFITGILPKDFTTKPDEDKPLSLPGVS
jgi:hypothetical protein